MFLPLLLQTLLSLKMYCNTGSSSHSSSVEYFTVSLTEVWPIKTVEWTSLPVTSWWTWSSLWPRRLPALVTRVLVHPSNDCKLVCFSVHISDANSTGRKCVHSSVTAFCFQQRTETNCCIFCICIWKAVILIVLLNWSEQTDKWETGWSSDLFLLQGVMQTWEALLGSLTWRLQGLWTRSWYLGQTEWAPNSRWDIKSFVLFLEENRRHADVVLHESYF